uniref:Uncharacterized protein n=1 Tax=Onchocerca volvulus TaxID=6282 RepID=A0A8R1XYV4_ONCVO
MSETVNACLTIIILECVSHFYLFVASLFGLKTHSTRDGKKGSNVEPTCMHAQCRQKGAGTLTHPPGQFYDFSYGAP